MIRWKAHFWRIDVGMEFQNQTAYHGPNAYWRRSIIHLSASLAPVEQKPILHVPNCADRLAEIAVPIAVQAEIARLNPNLAQRLAVQTNLLNVFVLLAVELQQINAADVGYANGVCDGSVGEFVCEFEDLELGQAALQAANRLVNYAWQAVPLNVPQMLRELRNLSERVCLGPSTRAIYRAAQQRGIFAHRLNRESLVQFGQGAKQHRIRAAETDHTSAIAESIAGDKDLTKTLLEAVGVPVPQGRTVSSPEDAWSAAEEIGMPVVVKPRDANHGRGVAINLTSREKVMAAYPIALQEGSGVLVEKFTVGREHRLLVVGERVVAAMHGEPETVTGDGALSVRQLIEKLNDDPRRGEDYADPLSLVELDAIALSTLDSQGLNPDSVPTSGQQVLIHYNGDLTTDETELVHPDVEAACVAAAKGVGLDIAGIDLIATDISRPLLAQGGAIVEVNAGPGLVQHVRPLIGKPQPVGEAIVATLFDDDDDGRIPLVCVLGGALSDAVTSSLHKLFLTQGKCAAKTSADGVFVRERRVLRGDHRRGDAVYSVVVNSQVNAGALEVSPESLLLKGLYLDHCSAAVVMEDAPVESLGLLTPHSAGQILASALRPQGLLVLGPRCDPARYAMVKIGQIVLLGEDSASDQVQTHLANGGMVMIDQGDQLVRMGGGRAELRTHLAHSLAELRDQPKLAAVAAATVMQLLHGLITEG
jgi:cyanophycin synthetase